MAPTEQYGFFLPSVRVVHSGAQQKCGLKRTTKFPLVFAVVAHGGTAKDDPRSTQCGLMSQVCKLRLAKSPVTKMQVM